jgi:hypothetical protein
VPVRIIFRGLMLFQIPESGANAGKLVAYLINDAEFGASPKGRAHDHNAEIQILTGAERGAKLVPRILKREATLDIVIRGPKGVSAGPSFDHHVPDLDAVIASATQAIKDAGRDAPNRDLIQNVVTVDRGIVRARDVVEWDQGGYPLSGNPAEVGELATSPAVAKFMGSSVRGHMASDVIVEIDDAQGVQFKSGHDRRFNVRKRGVTAPTDPHMPARTVEILITNYERPGDKPTPWGLDFQWLFEAAGYNDADLAGPEFTTFVDAGRAYDPDLFDTERALFLGGEEGTTGRPFPYLESADSLTPLQPLQSQPLQVVQQQLLVRKPLTNPKNVRICVNAKAPATDTALYTETVTLPGGAEITREWRLVPGDRAAQKKLAKRKLSAKKPATKAKLSAKQKSARRKR